MSLVLQFQPDASRAGWFARRTRSSPLALVRRSLPPYREKPWFLPMRGIKIGTQEEFLVVRGEPVIIGLPRLRETFGRMQLAIESDESWVNPRRDWSVADGAFMEFTGRLNLGHSLPRIEREQARRPASLIHAAPEECWE